MQLSNLFVARQKNYGQKLAEQFTGANASLTQAEEKIVRANGIDRITSARLGPVVDELEKGPLGKLMSNPRLAADKDPFPSMTEARRSWETLTEIGHMSGSQLSGSEGVQRRKLFERAFESLQSEMNIGQAAVLEGAAAIDKVAPAAPIATTLKLGTLSVLGAGATVGGMAIYDTATGSDTMRPVRETASFAADRLGEIASS